MAETTALGAGLLAGLGAGVWHSPRELAAARVLDREFKPKRDAKWRAAEWSRHPAEARAAWRWLAERGGADDAWQGILRLAPGLVGSRNEAAAEGAVEP